MASPLPNMKATTASASIVLALVICLTAAIGIAAASSTPPSLMSRADYDAALRAVRFDTRMALSQCRSEVEPSARAVCRAEARAAERVAVANLDARYRGTIAALERARTVEDAAEYTVDVARRLTPA